MLVTRRCPVTSTDLARLAGVPCTAGTAVIDRA